VETMTQSVGMLLKTLRAKLGLTQLEVGGMVGVTDRAVSAWERDASLPSREHAQVLDKRLGAGGKLVEAVSRAPTPQRATRLVGSSLYTEMLEALEALQAEIARLQSRLDAAGIPPEPSNGEGP
jgi:transcriptional regulator with XRE-family HTH domain